ncbi:LOW QUALITY PROTEIN: ZW10 interactor-like [Pteronotus mesoamericanus]|uniref:LOW QUALITY PROTEIN: ZW10 interactor-like n=1 Tax=Pteronotus mesoamericanus TaxID=1884717 RepID=UPI0023EADA3D|nr:LOW QUALITY PROTEIN: ZW10 interactor-like [Pteronotus parnellii mesoamericanus]
MPVAETAAEASALEALAQLASILEPTGLQKEAGLPAQILAEFVMDSRKKDKLLCSQLQVVDFLQDFLAQEDAVQGLDPLASEDTSQQKATAAKEHWKELKATYEERVEAITGPFFLTQALPKMEEAQRKQAQVKEALDQLRAKKQVAMEKLRTAQKQWQLQQEKSLQHLAEVSAKVRARKTGIHQEHERLYQELGTLKQQAEQERDKLQRHQTFLQLLYTLQGQLQLPEAEAELPQHWDLPEEKAQQLAQPQEQNTGDTVGRDGGVPSKVGWELLSRA